jgi:hypothetical protein
MIHLLINPTVEPEDYIALCGNDAVEFTTDINRATCTECVECELDYVHNPDESGLTMYAALLADPAVWESSEDERGEPLFI